MDNATDYSQTTTAGLLAHHAKLSADHHYFHQVYWPTRSIQRHGAWDQHQLMVAKQTEDEMNEVAAELRQRKKTGL